MFYRLNWNAAARKVALESGSGSAPAAIGSGGYVDGGSFKIDNDNEQSTGLNGMQGLADNHVAYHHVQDYLYKQGVLDMQRINITLDKARSLSIGSGTVTVAAGADSAALPVTVTPTTAPNKEVIFSTSDATKATVNDAGVVHGVAAGNAVITAKLKVDQTIQATRNVTVTA